MSETKRAQQGNADGPFVGWWRAPRSPDVRRPGWQPLAEGDSQDAALNRLLDLLAERQLRNGDIQVLRRGVVPAAGAKKGMRG